MPRNAFLKQFGAQAQDRDYLAAQRWPDGLVCPKCGHKHGCRLSNGLYQRTHCQNCVVNVPSDPFRRGIAGCGSYLSGAVEFDDACFGGPTAGRAAAQKRRRSARG